MSCENLHREFERFLKENGLPNIRFHDLCHTSLTFLLEMGTPSILFNNARVIRCPVHRMRPLRRSKS
jgi:hypothetical protein